MGIGLELSDRRRMDDVAAVDVVMRLRAGERHLLAGLFQLRIASDVAAVGRPELVGVEADLRTGVAGALAAVAEVAGDAPRGVTRHDADRAVHFLAARLDRDDVARFERELFRVGRADEDGVVPRELRERLRRFLQPAVVGVAAVADRRIGQQYHLERRIACGGDGGQVGERVGLHRRRLGANAVSAMTPSASALCQPCSNPPPRLACQVARTRS